jgi:hypothetical protein
VGNPRLAQYEPWKNFCKRRQLLSNQKESHNMIPAVIERCAGIDIGKEIVAVCMMTGAAGQDPRCQIREYGTTTGELQQL